MIKKPKRDFVFIDETGDPGNSGSPYYICTLFHVSDADIHQLYSVICSFRFMLDHYHEIHGHYISNNRLLKLNKLLCKKKGYFKCSVVYLDKKNYKGPYLNRFKSKRNPVLFRKYIYRQVLNLHFSKYGLISKKLEIVFDRSNLSEADFNNLRYYISRWGNCPGLESITEVDSKYVELLQLADAVGAQFIPVVTRNGIGQQGFSYSFINQKDISLSDSLGDVYQSKN